ncbi:hypothetical protein LWI29_016918 [Acer saccharum]|uniref:40S ribosomal protein S7 n=1 Tax=Acer saccharum TaxID=4024 RepID=A0AA39T456_ACESA|nr:hypothetical protein LWI29_016918 [Acer saccharum]
MEEMKSIVRLGLAVAGGGWTRRREGDSWVVQCAAVSLPVEVNGLEGTVENRSVKMYTAKKKIQKDHDAQALFDLENTNQELKSDLKDLYINQAIQMDVAGNRKAIVVYVPFRLRKAYDHKVHVRLVTMMWGCSLSLNCFVQSGLC